ncbi:MAG: M28 family peptidase [Dehalococcoidia bacterium]
MRFPAPALLAALLIFAGCKGGSPEPTPTPTPEPTPTATAALTPTPAGPDIGPAAFDAARAFAHVQALTVDIGSRPAGSESELEAAQYLQEQLTGFGYEAELQPFPFEVFADAGSSLRVLSPRRLDPAVYPLEPSANGVAEGPLVAAGIGRAEDFPAPSTPGSIVLVERGTLTFSAKVSNAAAAGALGVIVYNDEPGLFSGDLDGPSALPALSIAQADGEELLDLLDSGPVTVRLEVATDTGPKESQNVVARPPGGQCRVVAGGHYDSVPAGPGANDNASGTATAVEIARVLAADGELDDVCFVLFGSEEIGLLGSLHYVEALTPEEHDSLEAMLNLDMVGVGTRWLLAGSQSVVEVVSAEAEARGLDFDAQGFEFGGSDHASFINAGIPAVFMHAFTNFVADDPNYHTANDVADNVRATTMSEIGEVGLAAIEELLAAG